MDKYVENMKEYEEIRGKYERIPYRLWDLGKIPTFPPRYRL